MSIALTLIGAATAGEPAAPVDAEVVVLAEADRTSAGERVLDRTTLDALPGRTADDYLRAMPGLHASAHGGRGKAYQFFLRGFDAVHGADLAVSVEGVPINEPSNVHAHGYLDLPFVPLTLVRELRVSPGTARADVGDFAVAGSADYRLGLERSGGAFTLALGTDRSVAASVAWRPEASERGTFVVAEIDNGGGVGDGRTWLQARGGFGWEVRRADLRLRSWLLAYHGTFDSPGALRLDDVEDGRIDFYGAYPGSGGGVSSRVLGAVQASGGGRVAWTASVHGGWRSLMLQQNFTGFTTDPVRGDGTLQAHEAGTAGVRATLAWSAQRWVGVRAGLSARVDAFTQGEQRVDAEGEPLTAATSREATQADVGVWAALPLRPTHWLRIEPGLRAEALVVAGENVGGGTLPASAPALAPKALVTLFPDGLATAYVSYGRGFRSPDARGVVQGGPAPVALADSVEVGLTSDPHPRVGLRADAYATFVSDEIVFDHVAARYLATGSTRRLGGDLGLTVRPASAVRLEADLSITDGRYTTTGLPVPYAPRVLATVGAYLDRLRVRGVQLTAGLRTWVLGPRPLPGGFASHATAVVDLTGQVEVGPWSVTLDVDNLLASRWRDGEFVYVSRWDRSAPSSALGARHLTAGAPFALRLGFGRRF